MAAEANVRMVQIRDRELHGKFLLWDSDHLVLTSLNWSSADTRTDAPQREIGIYVQSPGIAEDVRRRLLEECLALEQSALRPQAPADASSRRGIR